MSDNRVHYERDHDVVSAAKRLRVLADEMEAGKIHGIAMSIVHADQSIMQMHGWYAPDHPDAMASPFSKLCGAVTFLMGSMVIRSFPGSFPKVQ